jgi:hypothetical protein
VLQLLPLPSVLGASHLPVSAIPQEPDPAQYKRCLRLLLCCSPHCHLMGICLILQRYKHEIRTEDRQPLKELLRRQYHHQVCVI